MNINTDIKERIGVILKDLVDGEIDVKQATRFIQNLYAKN